MEAAVTTLKENAVRPFHGPRLPAFVVALQAHAEITVDHLRPDSFPEGTG
jgi:hypothetical protein